MHSIKLGLTDSLLSTGAAIAGTLSDSVSAACVVSFFRWWTGYRMRLLTEISYYRMQCGDTSNNTQCQVGHHIQAAWEIELC
jgi:hypothetical protein